MGTQLPPWNGAQQPPHFSVHVYCGQTVAHLSNCWAVVMHVFVTATPVTLEFYHCMFPTLSLHRVLHCTRILQYRDLYLLEKKKKKVFCAVGNSLLNYSMQYIVFVHIVMLKCRTLQRFWGYAATWFHCSATALYWSSASLFITHSMFNR